MKELGQQSFAAKEQDPCLCPDEGRKNQRQGGEGLQDRFPGEMKPCGEEPEGNANCEAKDHGQGAHPEAISKAPEVEGFAEDLLIAFKGELARFRAEETGLEDIEHRVEDKKEQNDEGR